ncbi:hypothetical protein PPL_08628 [Heterostelium album PN500]|uniref:RNase H type-1 domain-containing protein n=1 Tax=Heterostelium pallidum (strain ATCC 26659 / Pp 5 / PN500) TaxID=670386 RepID=D3BJA3_HETP5|nr:hypothetical protein PPL_08628 [Heterostelium album PN500]EFA77983.1 hypothetical protein PPL_08628 [Heterostelium album PN500]|eukprot:XP_020430111.1 hypothetical protein PPL_08628 [Heterostelium album PN500]
MISNQIHSVPPPQTTNTMNQQQQQQQQQQPLYSNGNGSSNSPLNGYTTVGLGGDFISNNVNIGDINNVDMYNRKRKAETEQIIEQHYQLQDQQLQSQPPLPQLLPTQTQTQIQTPTQTPPLLQQPQQQQQQTIQQAKPTTPQSSSPTPPNVDNATINAPDSKREKPTEIEKIVIYTDGACRRNPGPGSWGCLIFEGDNIKTLDEQTAKSLCGGEVKTTNNRMELMAVIQGLEKKDKQKAKKKTNEHFHPSTHPSIQPQPTKPVK